MPETTLTEIHNYELVFPEHANPSGAAFGGFVLGLMDKVSSYAAAKFARASVVTVAVSSVEFKIPIRVGDLLQVVAKVTKHGRTSITVEVEVHREVFGSNSGESQLATSGDFTFVSVNNHGEPIPLHIE